jgi:hypothetical protein
VNLGSRRLRRYLKHLRAGCRRTALTVRYKQDPAEVARAEAVLENLRAKVEAGELESISLDESGFAPSLPCGYSWALLGQRKRVAYEYLQGRRGPTGPTRRPLAGFAGVQADLDLRRPARFSEILARLGGAAGGGPGQSQPACQSVVEAELRALARRGISFYYLPA